VTLADSGVWIDYFRGAKTEQTEKLNAMLGVEPIVVGDLILMEVLQGFTSDRDFKIAERLLSSFRQVDMAGRKIAIQAAKNYRFLRSKGISIRKSIDVFIATWCLESGCALLHCDRDFEPFTEYLGLRTV
jgi:predicted nucleic acid-binding protein